MLSWKGVYARSGEWVVVCLVLFFIVSVRCCANHFDDFLPFQYQLPKEYVEQKIVRYLHNSQEIENYYEIQEDRLLLFASLQDKEKSNPEYQLFFKNGAFKNSLRCNASPETQKKLGVDHIKIALDPGHFGGKYARLEKRYIDMEHNGEVLQFDEGTLSFLTALHLKNRLEEHGVSVLLTRKAIGVGAYSLDFFDWLKNCPEHWETEEFLPAIFRKYYNILDLKERARIINEYQPDLTFIIHYNSCDSTLACSKKTKVTHRNFNIVFIPGAFCQGELSTSEDRYHFLRLICTQDLEQSLHIAKHLVAAFTSYLQVAPLKLETQKFHSCRKAIADGVFSRNFCLTRLVKGPLCYGESLIQNNLQEALALNKKDAMVNGIPCPQRVIDVAEAYLGAILSYFK